MSPDDPLAGQLLAAFDDPAGAWFAASPGEAGTTSIDGVPVRWSVFAPDGVATRWRRFRAGLGMRSASRSAFAVHRRAEHAELGVPASIGLLEFADRSVFVTRWEAALRPLVDAASLLDAATVVRALVALHAWGFVERFPSADAWRVLPTPGGSRLVPVSFAGMRWSKYVDPIDRSRHLAAWARFLPDDPFGFLEGAGTRAYVEASCLRVAPAAFLESVRRAAAEE